jgi:hypothetical protein
MNQKRCRHCHTIFFPNPRIKNQRYCNRPECQRGRKTLWQKHKMLQDRDYQANHREAQRNWLKRTPDYWKGYRARRERRWVVLAKMDALRPHSFVKPGSYLLVPDLAKKDSLAQKIFIIPDTSTDWSFLAKKDSIDLAPDFSYHSP